METSRFVLLLCLVATLVVSAPVPQKAPEGRALGQVFDEVVVESTLTVRGKDTGSRQGRRLVQKASVAAPPAESSTASTSTSTSSSSSTTTRTRREAQRQRRPGGGGVGFPSSSAAAGSAQAQGFNVAGPGGSNWGASATQTGTQAFTAGRGGISGSAGASGTQQYKFPNGMTIDVAFGNTFGASPGGSTGGASSSVTVTGPNGSKRVIPG